MRMRYSLRDLLKKDFKSLKGKRFCGVNLYKSFYGTSILGSEKYRIRYTLIYIPVQNPSEFEKIKEILDKRRDWYKFDRKDVMWSYIKKHTNEERIIGWSIISLLKLRKNLFLKLFVKEPVEENFLKEIKELLIEAIFKDR